VSASGTGAGVGVRRGLVRTILGNAGSLAGTTVVTAVLGFAFWALAARFYPPDIVGYASATVSAMLLVGTVGTLGLEQALIGEMAERPGERGRLVVAGLVASAVGSALLAGGCLLVARLAGLHAGGQPVLLRADLVTLFVVGVALTGATFVLDAALVGALQGGVQLHRNVAFSVVKLGLLAATGVALADEGTVGLLGAWVVGILCSLAWTAIVLRRRRIAMRHAPAAASVRLVMRRAAPHNWLNIALESSHLVTPILATALVTATAGGVFYAAWMMISFLFILPFHLGTVLYATGAADVPAVPHQARMTLRISVLAGLAGIPGLIVAGPWVLELFGPTYRALGTVPLLVLTAGYPPMVVVAHYVALCRIERRVLLAAGVLTMGVGVELGLAAAGAVIGGLVGLAVGVVVGKWIECGLTLARVVRVARTPDQPSSVPAGSVLR
jgi:O-antigen/teichoic acid export membrane protein